MKKGFTLIELLVYMAIMGFIIVVAGRVYSDSTSMRVRTQSMTVAMEEVNKVAALIKEDLSQMGAKGYRDENNVFHVIEDVYMDADDDFSSYTLEHEAENSKITFRKIAFNNDGEYVGVREITWELDSETPTILLRSCETINPVVASLGDPEGALCDGEPVAMAANVRAFALLPSSPGVPHDPSNPISGGTSTWGSIGFNLIPREAAGEGNIIPVTIENNTTVKDFARNLEENDKNMNQIFVGNAGEDVCRQYSFIKGETYSLSFQTPLGNEDNPIKLFQPRKDHASIGFRGTNGEKISDLPSDFLFYIPQTKANSIDTMWHYFEFSAKEDVHGACAMFTFAFYSPIPDGSIPPSLTIKDFEVKQKNEAYHFVREGDDDYDQSYATDDPNEKDKVKAFELLLELEIRGEIGSTRPVSGSNGYVIQIPNNGVKL